jgi:hypothetical protein
MSANVFPGGASISGGVAGTSDDGFIVLKGRGLQTDFPDTLPLGSIGSISSFNYSAANIALPNTGAQIPVANFPLQVNGVDLEPGTYQLFAQHSCTFSAAANSYFTYTISTDDNTQLVADINATYTPLNSIILSCLTQSTFLIRITNALPGVTPKLNFSFSFGGAAADAVLTPNSGFLLMKVI